MKVVGRSRSSAHTPAELRMCGVGANQLRSLRSEPVVVMQAAEDRARHDARRPFVVGGAARTPASREKLGERPRRSRSLSAAILHPWASNDDLLPGQNS